MNLYEKMFAVMNDSEAIEKNMTVGSSKNSYKAVSEASMLNMVKPLFKKHRLIIFPVDGEIKDHCMVWNKTDYNGKTSENLRAMTELKVIYRIQDIDSKEFQDVVGFGNGSDPQDKGAGKASTYSFKNVLSKTFMLFSGEDTDKTHSDDIGEKTEKEIKEHDKSKIDKVKVASIKTMIFKSKTNEKSFLKWAKVAKVEDIIFENFGKCANQLERAVKAYEKKTFNPKKDDLSELEEAIKC